MRQKAPGRGATGGGAARSRPRAARTGPSANRPEREPARERTGPRAGARSHPAAPHHKGPSRLARRARATTSSGNNQPPAVGSRNSRRDTHARTRIGGGRPSPPPPARRARRGAGRARPRATAPPPGRSRNRASGAFCRAGGSDAARRSRRCRRRARRPPRPQIMRLDPPSSVAASRRTDRAPRSVIDRRPPGPWTATSIARWFSGARRPAHA
jgi:hypothetical protein